MIAEYWGIHRNVFSATLNTEEFFGSQSHEEVLARAYYLIESNKPLGLLVGENGVGKTLLLRILQQQAVISGRDVAFVDLNGLDENTMGLAIIEALRLTPCANPSRFELQMLIQKYCKSLKLSHSQLVLLLDNLHLCKPACLTALQQILSLGTLSNQCISTVIATEPVENMVHADWVSKHPAFLMSLACWSAQETRLYIEQTLKKSGAQGAIFEEAACARIFQYTQGLPMRVKQLSEFCLILAADQYSRQVSCEIVDQAANELNIAASDNEPSFRSSAVA